MLFVARYDWWRRLDSIRKLEQNAYTRSPVFLSLSAFSKLNGPSMGVDAILHLVDLDVDALLAGEGPQYDVLRTMVAKVESGEVKFCAADLEGRGARAHELGVALLDANGHLKPLLNRNTHDLPKDQPTGIQHPKYKYEYLPLLEDQRQRKALLDDMATVVDIASEPKVISVHFGGREQELFKALGVPEGLFDDALQIIRLILRARLNGHFPSNVRYGSQLRTATTGVRDRDAPEPTLLPRRACRSLCSSSSRPRRRIMAWTTPTSPAGC